jgi:ATP-dependent DNA ligase
LLSARPHGKVNYSCARVCGCDRPKFQPLALGRTSELFSHPDWLFEIKWDGFRSLVRIEQGKWRLISRKGNEFKSFRALNEFLLAEFKVQSAVMDGEIICLNVAGKPEFRDLLHRKGQPRFVAFDLPWSDGQDLTHAPLTERKHRLRSVIPKNSDTALSSSLGCAAEPCSDRQSLIIFSHSPATLGCAVSEYCC